MRSGPSLRRRMVAAIAVGTSLLWALGASVAAGRLAHELSEIHDRILQDTAALLLPLVGAQGSRAVLLAEDEERDVWYVAREEGGGLILSSPAEAATALPAGGPEGFSEAGGFRVYAQSAPGVRVQVAEPLAERRDAAAEGVAALVLPLLLLLPLTILGAWLAIGRGLRPILRLSAEVASRGAAELRPLDAGSLPRELEPLGGAINGLLGRVRAALEAERAFTADAAHELRTPVAAAMAQAQRLGAELSAGPGRDRAEALLTNLKRLAHLAEKLLQLARSEGAGVLAGTAEDLAPALEQVVAEFRREGRGRRIKLRLPPGGAAPSRLDVDAFGVLARNLIENALVHGGPTAAVEVEMTADGALTVTNGGPAVPAERLRSLTARFERGGSRRPGSGLGLAIAAALAETTGATLTLASPAPGRADGFEARFAPLAGG